MLWHAQVLYYFEALRYSVRVFFMVLKCSTIECVFRGILSLIWFRAWSIRV